MRFDDAMPAALEEVRKRVGAGSCPITVVRDVAGRLTVVFDDPALAGDDWEALAGALDDRLGRFSPGPQHVLLKPDELIDRTDVLDSPDRVRIPDVSNAWVVDRLLTNQEWLRQPRPARPAPPVATAFSLKGGVGRSTAVAVWARYLAREGYKVVAIDLDLEAPGLSSLLADELPTYGMVDWLVESLLGEPDQELLADCLAFSRVAGEAEGVVQVLPAFGEKTGDYVAKLGRVYLPGLAPTGEIGLADRLARLVEMLASREDPPDVVLLDSRAGLHDIGAAAVTQLGAEVFLFARDEPQSWRAYELLFEHLARSHGVDFGMPERDLRWRLKMVAAQIDKTEGAVRRWVDSSYDAWSPLYDGEPIDDLATGVKEPRAQTFMRDEVDAPHHPLTVYFEPQMRGVDLLDDARRPPWSSIEAAFGEFLVGATRRLQLRGDGDGGVSKVVR